ncbi:hypothetical protein AAHA92_01821 [Salvia divinorum]|uniref:Uncharacterized protein n=1 Tax=Salvia divinorum TaxID=28513 RepID=A0ABD1ICF7_SALDI
MSFAIWMSPNSSLKVLASTLMPNWWSSDIPWANKFHTNTPFAHSRTTARPTSCLYTSSVESTGSHPSSAMPLGSIYVVLVVMFIHCAFIRLRARVHAIL